MDDPFGRREDIEVRTMKYLFVSIRLFVFVHALITSHMAQIVMVTGIMSCDTFSN